MRPDRGSVVRGVKNLDIDVTNRDCDVENLDFDVVNRDIDVKNLDFDVVNRDIDVKNLDIDVINRDIDVENPDIAVRNLDIDVKKLDIDVETLDFDVENLDIAVRDLDIAVKIWTSMSRISKSSWSICPSVHAFDGPKTKIDALAGLRSARCERLCRSSLALAAQRVPMFHLPNQLLFAPS